MREDDKGRTARTSAVPSSRGDGAPSTSDPSPPAAEQPEVGTHDDDDRSGAPLSPDMQHFIGRQLRAVYDDVAKQPVPDRFLELMRQLDTKTGTR